MAQPGTAYLANRHAPVRRAGQQLPTANADSIAPRPQAPAVQPIDLDHADALYQQLLELNRHEQTYSRNLSYVAEGTELRLEYDQAISTIRTRAEQIRNRLGVDVLSWFHF